MSIQQRDYDALERILNDGETTKDELVEFVLLMIEEEQLDLLVALRHWNKARSR